MAANTRNVAQVIPPTSPYFIGTNDVTNSGLVNPVLTGPNYFSWKRGMEIAIGSKNKLGFVNGSFMCPVATDNMYGNWVQCNLIVMGWILNSVSPEIAQSILYAETAAKMWNELSERFAQSNEPRLYELYQLLHSTKQDQLSISTYYTKLETIWNDIGLLNPMPRCECGVISTCTCKLLDSISAREQKLFQMVFLMGLNESYSATRGQILLMKPLPPVNEIYAMLTQEEKQRSVSYFVQHQNSAFNPGVALAVHHYKNKGSLKCSFCNGTNHTREKCYKLHGFPPGWKFKNQNQNKGLLGANPSSTAQVHNVVHPASTASMSSSSSGFSPSPSGFSAEQLQGLCNYLQNHLKMPSSMVSSTSETPIHHAFSAHMGHNQVGLNPTVNQVGLNQTSTGSQMGLTQQLSGNQVGLHQMGQHPTSNSSHLIFTGGTAGASSSYSTPFTGPGDYAEDWDI